MTRGGLLIAGKVVPVPGLDIANPLDTLWCRLSPGDYRMRSPAAIDKVIAHTTKGIAAQHIIPGAGVGGKDKVVADFWRGDPEHSAAQLVGDTDGTWACLGDLSYVAAYHATYVNNRAIGVELYQMPNGGIYEATLATWRVLAGFLCDRFGIPRQMPDRYTGKPIARLAGKTGGPDCVGLFGHRHQTSNRGAGDPGEFAFAELVDFERFDFERGEDLAVWKRRQQRLNALGEKLVVDGVAGRATMTALRRQGFASGRELDAAVELPLA
jgi:hypothetical protein